MQRKGITLTTIIFPLLTSGMLGAPDPDIFDGRSNGSEKSDASSGSQGSQQSAGGQTVSSGGTTSGDVDEALDSATREGQPVSTHSSKTGHSGGVASERGSADPKNSQTGSGANGGSGEESKKDPSAGGNADLGTSKNGQGTEKGQSANPSAGKESVTERNFEKFGFGGGHSTEVKEVVENSSKVSSSSGGTTPAEAQATDPAQSSGSGGQKGSKPNPSKSTGDYGTNLPSGI